MQYIVAGHNITVYHICILHSVINVFCTLVQKRCYVIDAKDSEIQYFKVHTTNSLQIRLQSYTKKMTYANLYAIFFGIFVIWFCFSSVCSLVLDYFAGDAFVAGDIDHIDAGRKISYDTPKPGMSSRVGALLLPKIRKFILTHSVF